MIPQPFPPFPFPPFPPSPFSPFLLFSFSSFAFSSARRSHLRWLRCGFILCINPSFRTFRTPVPIVVYQPCPPSLSVPQKPLPCTNRALHPVPYLRSPSCVPTVSSIPFRTAEAPPVYQPCPSIPFRTAEAPLVYLLCPSPRFVPRINLF